MWRFSAAAGVGAGLLGIAAAFMPWMRWTQSYLNPGLVEEALIRRGIDLTGPEGFYIVFVLGASALLSCQLLNP